MKRNLIIVLTLGALLGAGAVDAFDAVADWYMFPISARANGQAGTQWKTELCIDNPHTYDLSITMGLLQNGGWVGGGAAVIEVGAKQSICDQDVYATAGVGNGSGMIYLFGDPNNNPGHTYTTFGAKVKIYNDSSSGTFGQTITPVTPNNYGWLPADSVLAMSGIQNYGTAGSSGFRTNYGISNMTDSSATCTVIIFDKYGNVKSTMTKTVGPFTVKQYSLNNTIRDGRIVVIPNVEGVAAYASIVDNKSGDGSFLPHWWAWLD